MSKSKKSFVCWLTKCEKTSANKGMAGFLIKKGIVKSKGMANVFLLLLSFIFSSLAVILMFNTDLIWIF